MNAAADLVWIRIPAAVRRFWATLGVALGDGGYLRAWPTVAVVAPVVAFALGLVLGATHPLAVPPGTVYTYSLFTVAVLGAIGGLGAGLGCWAWLGFVLADLAVVDRTPLPAFGLSRFGAAPTDLLLHGYVPLLTSYLLLAGLVVVAPLVASGFARRTVLVLRRRRELALPAAQLVRVVTVALFTYGWARATPFMIRPLWSFSGYNPDINAIQPIQGNVAGLTALMALVGLGRAALVLLSAGRLPRPEGTRPVPAGPAPVARVLRLVFVPLQALFITLLLAGLVDHLWQGAFVWLLLSLIMYARILLIPRIPGYYQLIGRVPMLVRILACALVSYALTSVIVQPAVASGQRSFLTLVVVVFASLIVAAFLLPAPPPAQPQPAAPGHPGGPPQSHGPPQSYGPPHNYGPPPGPGQPAHRVAGLSWARRAATVALAAVALLGLDASPALADNCSGLSDCSFGVKIALVVAGIALVLLAWWLLPEILGAAALEEEEAAILLEEEAEVEAEVEAEAEAQAEAQAQAQAEAEAQTEAEAQAEAARLRQLGEDPATGAFRQSEMETAGRVENELGVKLQRSPDPNVDWVDANGKTYDAVGNFDARYFDQQWPNLQARIMDHLAKADYVPVDVSKFSPAQIAQVQQFIQNLGPRVFLVGN